MARYSFNFGDKLQFKVGIGKEYGFTSIPYHTMPYNTIQYHTIPCHAIPYHTIPYQTIPYHTIPYHTIPYHTIPYHTIPYHTIPCFDGGVRGQHNITTNRTTIRKKTKVGLQFCFYNTTIRCYVP